MGDLIICIGTALDRLGIINTWLEEGITKDTHSTEIRVNNGGPH
jgi:hypothetical protein